MRKILFVLTVVALCAGCGRRGGIAVSGSGHSHDTHEHSAGCSHGHSHDHSHDAHSHNHDAHDHDDCNHGSSTESASHDADEIVFTAEQAQRTDFEVQTVVRGVFRDVITAGGNVSAAQSGMKIIAAPVSGIAALADRRMMSGSVVRKGETLFRIVSGGLATGDAVQRARVNYEQAKANYERQKSLFADRLITQSELLTAEAAYLTAKVEYDPMRGADNAVGVLVTAPVDGFVTEVNIAEGDFVEMGQPLATVAGATRMQLTVMVPQRYFGRLSSVVDANFIVSGADGYYNVSSLNGKLISVGRVVSPGSTLLPVVFEFDSDGSIPDGAQTEAALLGKERTGVLTIPLTAITEQQGLFYVYVQLDGEHYARHEVGLGANDGVNVEILSGVAAGDRVVTRGAVNVKMASASGAIPHGHTH